MSNSKSRAAAFCDEYQDQHGRAPTLLELIATVGWVAPRVVRQLADRGLIAGVSPRLDPWPRLFTPAGS